MKTTMNLQKMSNEVVRLGKAHRHKPQQRPLQYARQFSLTLLPFLALPSPPDLSFSFFLSISFLLPLKFSYDILMQYLPQCNQPMRMKIDQTNYNAVVWLQHHGMKTSSESVILRILNPNLTINTFALDRKASLGEFINMYCTKEVTLVHECS